MAAASRRGCQTWWPLLGHASADCGPCMPCPWRSVSSGRQHHRPIWAHRGRTRAHKAGPRSKCAKLEPKRPNLQLSGVALNPAVLVARTVSAPSSRAWQSATTGTGCDAIMGVPAVHAASCLPPSKKPSATIMQACTNTWHHMPHFRASAGANGAHVDLAEHKRTRLRSWSKRRVLLYRGSHCSRRA